MNAAGIEAIAALLRTEAGCVSLPVDVCSIAWYLGLRIVTRPIERWDGGLRSPSPLPGFLWLDPRAPVIVVNALTSRTRQRFTIGHEIAEALESDSFSPLRLTSPQRQDMLRPHEQLMNAFAAALLMPADAVWWEWCNREGETPEGFSALCRRFAVSKRAMHVRLQDVLTNVDAPL